MKTIVLFLSLLLCGATYAQEKKNNKKEETETKTVKVKTEKGTVEKKVQVKTTEESDIELIENPDHYENMTRVDTPTKVTKTLSIDYDDDPFYDTTEQTQYFTYDGTTYGFEPTERGFAVSKKDGAEANNMAKARLSSISRFYLVEMGEHQGVGYFKDNGNFVVEYFDKDTNSMTVKEYQSIKQ
ncbi:MAG: hypothetical protein R3213_01775 [Flavobacteriaceae bacterium]|nr:hypothetical protein [Flavobacteriaceae bacterium]